MGPVRISALVAAAVALVPVDAQAIIGGRVAAAGELPWVAAVVEEAPPGTPFETAGCGGTLVAPRVVLTAGHCVTAIEGEVDPTRAGQVVLGRDDLRNAGAGEAHLVTRVVRHPFYDNDRLLYDLALLQLAEPAAAPPLPLVAQGSRFREGQRATVAGWGSTSDKGKRSPVLRTARLPLWGSSRCSRAYSHVHVTGLMLCAAGQRGGRDVCDGDSGGPLVVTDAKGGDHLLGVVSFGHAAGCATKRYPTNFAWVSSPFIRGWVTRRAAALDRGDVDATRPVVSGLRRSGVTVRYSLSEPAQVVLNLQRRREGRTTMLPTALVANGKAGENTVRLGPMMQRALAGRGALSLRAVATDGAGNVSARVTLSL